MPSHATSKLARLGSKSPRRRVIRAVQAGLSATLARTYASRLAGALPAFFKAPADTKLWRSALVGPARYPDGYRDVVILSEGRLLPSKVRQKGREGDLHEDPAAEISRVVAAYREEEQPHEDRLQRPLVPRVAVDAAWLRKAARRHDVPLNPSLAAALLEELHRIGAAEKFAFRATLDPDVARLLLTDEDLDAFHDWLSDHRVAAEILRRRQVAFAALRAGCQHIRKLAPFALRLDAGEEAVGLLGEILDAAPKALKQLAQRHPRALDDFHDAQRKAWAIELMPAEAFAELSRDLDRAGGWAGRAMSLSAIVSDDSDDRRRAARRLLARPGLGAFIDYYATVSGWSFEEGRKELAGMLSAIVRFGLLPNSMLEADAGARQAPSPARIAWSVSELARIISVSFGAMAVEIARLQWRKVEPWISKNLIATCHPSLARWPALIGAVKGVHADVDCLASRAELQQESGSLRAGPTILYDVLVEGAHVLRLRDKDGATVALAVVRQAEVEAAVARGRCAAADIDREGWAADAQWKRWMRVEVARVIDRIARRKIPCDIGALRRQLDDRAREAADIAARPCGFDHANAEALKLAAAALESVMKHVVRNAGGLPDHLFGPRRDPLLEADAAFLNGAPAQVPAPAIPAPAAPAAASSKERLSALLLPPSGDEILAPAEYHPSGAAGRIRLHMLAGRAAAPKDPLTARFVVMDTETTGLDGRHRVIEVAAIELIGPHPTDRTFSALIDPGMPISDGAFDKHGISDDMLRGQPAFAEIADGLIKFLEVPGSWFVAHKADFDVGFLNREFERAGRKFRIPANRTICTLKMATSCLSMASLDDACDRLGIDRTSRLKHRAMLDAELCAEVFRQLVFGRKRPSDDAAQPPDAADLFQADPGEQTPG